MTLLLDDSRTYSYRDIRGRTGAAFATITKAKQALERGGISTQAQLDGLGDDEIMVLVDDGRIRVSEDFVAINFDEVLAARTGRNKTALIVLWSNYPDDPAPQGQRHYSYERFRRLVPQETHARGLTMRIQHVPGQKMEVDWAGTKMTVVDPITGRRQLISIFVASLPYSGLIFAYGCDNERHTNWLTAHRLAFEYFGGVADIIVPG